MHRFLEKVSVPYAIYWKCIEVEKSLVKYCSTVVVQNSVNPFVPQERPNMKRLRELYDKATDEWGAGHPGNGEMGGT